MKLIEKSLWQYITPETNYYCFARITLKNGARLELNSINDFTVADNSYTHSGGQGFPIGQALCKTIKLTIDNSEQQYSQYDFNGAEITLWTEFDAGNNNGRLLEGYFLITDTIDTRGNAIEITAYDNMVKADIPFVVNKGEPAIEVVRDSTTVYSFFGQTCDYAGITIDEEFYAKLKPNTGRPYSGIGGLAVTYIPEKQTCRQMIAKIAGMIGGNAIILPNGKLTVKTYDTSINVISGEGFTDVVTDKIDAQQFTDTTSNQIDAGNFGTTTTINGVDYFIPSTPVLSNALDEIDTSTRDTLITALKLKYHKYLTGGATEEHTEIYGLSGNETHLNPSETYTYIATLYGTNSQNENITKEISLISEGLTISYDDSQNPDTPQYDDVKKVASENTIYYMQVDNTTVNEFGNRPIRVEISVYYKDYNLYKYILPYTSLSDMAGGFWDVIRPNGNKVEWSQSKDKLGKYYVNNISAFYQKYSAHGGEHNVIYGFWYQPSYARYEKYNAVEIEYITGQPSGISSLYTVLLGKRFRPFSGEFTADPTIEFMDEVYIEYNGEVYTSFISELTFDYLGASQFQNSGENSEQSQTTYATEANASIWERLERVETQVNQTRSLSKSASQQVNQTRSLSKSASQTVLLPTEIDKEGKIVNYITCSLKDGMIWTIEK